MSYQIALVEDDADTRSRLAMALASAPGVALIGQWASVSQAKTQLTSLSGTPLHAILVDLGLPDGSGIDVIRHCQKTHPQTDVLVITMFGDEANMISAFEAGAKGYILKDGSQEDVALHLQSLKAGGSPMSPIVARRLLTRLGMGQTGKQAKKTQAPMLTAKEQEVLRLLSRGYNYVEVSKLCNVSDSTIRTHVRNIYDKLEVHNKAEALFEARQLGLLGT